MFEDHWREKFHFSCSSQFSTPIGIGSHSIGEFSVLISSPERAFLEEFSKVYNSESFEYAAETFFLYSSWKLKLLRQLLMDSNSMHANRLFAFLIEKHSSNSLQGLDLSDVSMGRSVIQYVKRGKFISKYKIMVPEKYAESNESPF